MRPGLSLALGLLYCQDRSSSSLIALIRAANSLSFFRWTQLRPSRAWPTSRSSLAAFSIKNWQWFCTVCDWSSIGGDGSSANARIDTRTAIKTRATAKPQKVLGANGLKVFHLIDLLLSLNGRARLIQPARRARKKGAAARALSIARSVPAPPAPDAHQRQP